MIFDENEPKRVSDLLRSSANGTNARIQGFDITFNKAADMIDDLLAVIEEQEVTIGYLKGASS